jgi:hypothetical protein
VIDVGEAITRAHHEQWARGGSGSLPDPRSDQRRTHLRPRPARHHRSRVVALYDQLVRLDPSPIIALNRAVAVAELDGPEVALAAADRLEDKSGL